jgi:hypothetical protein
MNSRWMLVLLLLTGVAMANDTPGTAPKVPTKPKSAPAPAPAKVKSEPAKPKDEAKAKADEAKAKEDKTGAKDDQASPKDDQEKKDDPNLGMSILGNQEAPKALVIVPWKSSEIGQSLGVSTLLDDSRQPIDKEVFMRMLSYYGIRSNTTLPDGAPAGGRDAAGAERHTTQPAAAAHRRKS